MTVRLPKPRLLLIPRLAVAALAACLILALIVVGLRIGVAPSGVAHFEREGLALDYPAGWRLSVTHSAFGSSSEFPYFLGTGSGALECRSFDPSALLSEAICQVDLQVGAGQVVVELVWDENSPQSPRSALIDPNDPGQLEAGEPLLTVGGLPAVFRDFASVSGSDGVLSATWTLSVPERPLTRYLVVATMKGPGLEEMKAQVQALVAGIRFDDGAPVLDPADGPDVAARALDQEVGPEYNQNGCVSEPGAIATAALTSWRYVALARPLPVTCTMAIEPSQIGSWKMTLTLSWSAAADRSAGTHTRTIWLDADGEVRAETGGIGQTSIPYLP